MPIFLLLIGLLLPRVTAVLLWLFSDWFVRAYDTWIIPLLGFIFLPYSMLWFSAVQNWFGGVWGFWQIICMMIAMTLDVSSYSQVRRQP